jgi:hypothetical protein
MDDFPLIMESEVNPQTGRPDSSPVCVGFGLYAVEDAAASLAAGRPVYKDETFVKIVVPGDRNSVVFTKAKEEHKRRFPRAWAAYEQRERHVTEGTPLEVWPQMSRAQALTFRAAHIHTVEALAALSDAHLDNMGWDARQWRAKAQAYLEEATRGAAAQKLAAEKEVLEAQLAEMRTQMAALQKKYDAEWAAASSPATRGKR